MSDENQSESQSPFTRPGFIAAAIVVALIVVAGIVLVAVNVGKGDPKAAPTSSASSTSHGITSSPGPVSGDASVCGLRGVEFSGTVSAAPETTWKYQDVLAYPTSQAAGPGATAPSGYRYCFQHSPDGALFATANFAIMSFDQSLRSTWLPYVLAPGQHRDSLLSSGLNASNPSGIRASIAGFRVLSYDGEHAQVDVAFQATGSGQVVTGSFVAKLVWSDGDWKLDSSVESPAQIDQLPNLAGYTAWTVG